jgi:hypothetical protein
MLANPVEFVAPIDQVMDKFAKIFKDFLQVRTFVIKCMQTVGTSQSHAAQLADLLIDADLVGHYRLKKLSQK